MKKLCMVLLLIIATQQLIAQTTSEWIFVEDNHNKPTVKFEYNPIQKNIGVSFEFYSLKQLKYLPNIDSIIDLIKNDLQYLSDSLKEDAITRKLEYGLYNKPNRIRIINHTEQPTAYIVQNKELKQLKIDADTLMIKLTVFNEDSINFINYNNVKTKIAYLKPVYIKFYLRNLKDILDLKTGLVSVCLNDIKAKNEAILLTKRSKDISYYGNDIFKNVAFEKDVYRYWSIKRKEKYEFIPTIGFGLQNGNGAWLPSFNFGARLTSTSEYTGTTYWNLTLDNYFHFYNNANNDFSRDTYSFINLLMFQKENNQDQKGFQTQGSFGLGYLINRTGNLFDKGTFKMSFPSLTNGWLSITPEIFYKDFFKNTTLSLKLSINYE
jgi:hypothetical protein